MACCEVLRYYGLHSAGRKKASTEWLIRSDPKAQPFTFLYRVHGTRQYFLPLHA